MTQPVAPSKAPPVTLDLPRGPTTIIDEGEGTAVLAIHGLPGSTRDFRWLAPCLSSTHRFIRVDLPGFGQTPIGTGGGFSLDARAQFLAAVIDRLALERVIVMGHSIGGPAALAAAVKRPEQVCGVALICSVGLRPHPVFRHFNRRYVSRVLAQPLLRRAMMPRLRRGFIGAGFPRSISDDAIYHSIRYAATTKYEDHQELVSALQTTTLHAWAEDDHVIPPEYCRELAQACPDGPRLEFSSGGHNLQKTMAVELAEAIRSWSDGMVSR